MLEEESCMELDEVRDGDSQVEGKAAVVEEPENVEAGGSQRKRQEEIQHDTIQFEEVTSEHFEDDCEAEKKKESSNEEGNERTEKVDADGLQKSTYKVDLVDEEEKSETPRKKKKSQDEVGIEEVESDYESDPEGSAVYFEEPESDDQESVENKVNDFEGVKIEELHETSDNEEESPVTHEEMKNDAYSDEEQEGLVDYEMEKVAWVDFFPKKLDSQNVNRAGVQEGRKIEVKVRFRRKARTSRCSPRAGANNRLKGITKKLEALSTIEDTEPRADVPGQNGMERKNKHMKLS